MAHTYYPGCFLACAASLCLLLGIQSANSADIAHEVRDRSDASLSFEMGVQFYADDLPIVAWEGDDPEDPTGLNVGITLLLSGRAEWRRLFLEVINESFFGAAIGYSAWGNDHTRLDLLFTSSFGPYEPGIGEYESVNDRNADLIAGLRSTHNFDSTLVQFEFYSDVSGTHDGQTASVQVGKFKQVKNWNLHGLLGVRYFSDKMVDHYFGISEEESTESIPVYQASDGILASLEAGATVPLNEKWIFKVNTELLYLPDSVTDSPLADGRIGSSFTTSLNYVF